MTHTRETLLKLYSTMLIIRLFEERLAEQLSTSGDIKCPVHLYTGQEAVAAGVSVNLRNDDYVFSTHRGHGHYLAKGGDMNTLMAEIYGKTSGCSHGYGGSMHLAQSDIGLPGSSAIVAGTIPQAVGAALAFKTQHKDAVAIVFFGDGAANEGIFYESLNFAALKKLPVFFVCENNLYSTHMPISACLAETSIVKKAMALDVAAECIDGNNVIQVFETSQKYIAKARSGAGPALLECLTYRWRGHVGPNYDIDKGLRNKFELDFWMQHCPIRFLEKQMLDDGIVTADGIKQTNYEINAKISAAIKFARESAYPPQDKLLSNVFCENSV
jgi:TPP-dependent pyruvate/acetoin dehydrogenase alpha subunit